MESEFEGTINLNTRGDPEETDFTQLLPSEKVHLRLTGEDEDVNIGVSEETLTDLYRTLQYLEENTSLIDTEDHDSSE